MFEFCKVSMLLFVLLAAALLQCFTRRTAGIRLQAWVKFVPCVRALCSGIWSRQVTKQSCIASVLVGTGCISVVSRSVAVSMLLFVLLAAALLQCFTRRTAG